MDSLRFPSISYCNAFHLLYVGRSTGPKNILVSNITAVFDFTSIKHSPNESGKCLVSIQRIKKTRLFQMLTPSILFLKQSLKKKAINDCFNKKSEALLNKRTSSLWFLTTMKKILPYFQKSSVLFLFGNRKK